MNLREDLQALANRPLHSGQRGLLGAALLVLVLVAIGATLLGRNDSAQRRVSRPPAAPQPSAAVRPSAPASSASSQPEAAVSSAEVNAVRRATQRALTDYLSYLHADRRASSVRGITAGLRSQLQRAAVGRPHQAKISLLAVTPTDVTVSTAQAVARVQDASSSYELQVGLQRDDEAGWLVATVNRA